MVRGWEYQRILGGAGWDAGHEYDDGEDDGGEKHGSGGEVEAWWEG